MVHGHSHTFATHPESRWWCCYRCWCATCKAAEAIPAGVVDFLHLAGAVLLLLGGRSQGKLVLRRGLLLLLGRLHSLILPCFALDSASLCVLITFQRSVSINTMFCQ